MIRAYKLPMRSYATFLSICRPRHINSYLAALYYVLNEASPYPTNPQNAANSFYIIIVFVYVHV